MKRTRTSIACFVIMAAAGAHAQAGVHHGYLAPSEAPDSLFILPPPPAADSAAFLNDEAHYRRDNVRAGRSRMAMAIKDADYLHIGAIFSQAFGHTIDRNALPALSALMEKMLADSHDAAVSSAKKHYRRIRPFVFYNAHSCTPQRDAKLARGGSYPSGHATYGWAIALVLAEINPARQDALLKRGYDYGESRVVCGAHWQSDVEAGRVMGSAIVAALHGNQEFMAALAAAKQEFAAIRAR
ncbi:phosphatase PAP2 family protein [Herbaspirillum sp. SJZ099]|uniref:acid phosphatase n=1 Tax=Herbaspirillum sp. SJZ099 TaxID=2572916 RepID=UPI00119E6186|nr:phosphatase PAP2 family protein [Herbaspirillum sp. SJZ099]